MEYYTILGVNKNASREEIKKRYKDLTMKYHPDKNNEPDAQEKFMKINEAYKILSDPHKRDKYDASNDINTNEGNKSTNNYNFPSFNEEFDKAMKQLNDIFNSEPFTNNTNFHSINSTSNFKTFLNNYSANNIKKFPTPLPKNSKFTTTRSSTSNYTSKNN